MRRKLRSKKLDKKRVSQRESQRHSSPNIPKQKEDIQYDDPPLFPLSNGTNIQSGSKKSSNGSNGPKNGSSNGPNGHYKGSNTADKRKKKKNRQRRKKKALEQQNKKNSSAPSNSTSSPTPQCKSKGAESHTFSECATQSVPTSSSLSPASTTTPHKTADAIQRTIDKLQGFALDEERITSITKSSKSESEPKMESEPKIESEPSGNYTFDGSVGSGSMERDIDDGDHEDSLSKSLDDDDALIEEVQRAIDEKVDEENGHEDNHQDHNENHHDDAEHDKDLSVESKELTVDMATVQRQSEEIQMLKQSVSTLIDTVSKLEELVLFHQTNAVSSCCGDEHDVDDHQAMSEEIESLKQRVYDLENGGCAARCASGHEELRRWLTDEVALPQYVHVFVDNGFEDLVAVQTLNMDILDALDGIEKIGHKLRILKFVEDLRHSVDEESDTEETHEF